MRRWILFRVAWVFLPLWVLTLVVAGIAIGDFLPPDIERQMYSILCPPGTEIDITRTNYYPGLGTVVTTIDLECVGEDGVRRDVNFPALWVRAGVIVCVSTTLSLALTVPIVFGLWVKARLAQGDAQAAIPTGYSHRQLVVPPKTHVQASIIYNGQVYTSIDDMPADARRAYDKVMAAFADSDANGIPDILEGIPQVVNLGRQRGSQSRLQRLRELKEMLDVGLIRPQEYEEKKAGILSDM